MISLFKSKPQAKLLPPLAEEEVIAHESLVEEYKRVASKLGVYAVPRQGNDSLENVLRELMIPVYDRAAVICVNPRHLLAGSQKDNVADSIERGRFFRNR